MRGAWSAKAEFTVLQTHSKQLQKVPRCSKCILYDYNPDAQRVKSDLIIPEDIQFNALAKKKKKKRPLIQGNRSECDAIHFVITVRKYSDVRMDISTGLLFYKNKVHTPLDVHVSRALLQ